MMLLTNKNHKKKSDDQWNKEMYAQLGKGPMRFGPVRQECSVQLEAEQRGLSPDKILLFADIKLTWESNCTKEAKQKGFTNAQILRVAIFCDFHKRRALNLLQSTDPRYFELSAIDLGGQLRTRTLFPCPGLKTNEGANVFYMRPSRYSPKETPANVVIENLVFVMDKMTQNDATSDIALLANLEGWTMSNFSTEYCRKFMAVLQGHRFPAEVSLFLILNPPSWFGKVWKVMKPMLSPTFRKKVHMIREDDLFSFMDMDFEEYLPNEVRGGDVNTGCLVRDFVRYHQTLEQNIAAAASSSSATNSPNPPTNKAPVKAVTRKKFSFFGRKMKEGKSTAVVVDDQPTEAHSEHSRDHS